MVKISGTTIRMTRGDTAKIVLSLEDSEGNPYVPEPGDRIRFAMKRSYEDSDPVLIKEIPNDSLMLTIHPEDTKDFGMREKFVYDIEITYANGDVDTFIDKAKLVLTEEVH